MSRYLFLLFSVAVFHGSLFAQVAIGQWRDHVPYNQGVMVADAGDYLYSASESGLFQYHKPSGDVVRLSKINGMSDIGYSAIAWSVENNTLVVAYTNTNLDLIQDGRVINVPDIKNKSILGNKTIFNIHLEGDYAYLACGFAVVVLDMVKHEVKDTYYIGPNGSVLEVYDVTTSDNALFACTESGVYRAPKQGANLANYENWALETSLPSGSYDAATNFNNRIYVNLSTPTGIDSVYFLDGNAWQILPGMESEAIVALESTADRLVVVGGGSVSEFDASHERLRLAYDYGSRLANPRHATIDDDGVMWIADKYAGLVRHPLSLSFNFISVNGPTSTGNTDMSIWDGRCYVAAGSLTNTWANGYNREGVYTFKDNSWKVISAFSFPETVNFYDYTRVLVDPFDSKRTYISSWGGGLIELYDDELVALYDTTNSGLRAHMEAPDRIQASGMEIDRNTGTFWIVTSSSDKQLSAKDRNGQWYNFDISAINSITLGDMAIDNAGQKWIVAPRGVGLVVFNDNGTLSNTTDDQSIKLTQAVGNGNLASSNIFSIAADLDGEIWVGTDNGVSVFYSPESVFSGSGNFDSQQILVEQDGYVQYLLENESVTAIAVDGANRKWMGTANAGVFLMSDDGTEQIHHFTVDNSPLFSNAITSLGVDQLSGEVFIGTSKGIISFRGDATWGNPEFVPEEVYAYPNPVEPNYSGPIAIKGLVRDADVKITDAAGHVVFATIANGGQAIWDGNKMTGGRAQSGVYLVFASNEDGKETFVTKILFIN